jgi:hypothetical protein
MTRCKVAIATRSRHPWGAISILNSARSSRPRKCSRSGSSAANTCRIAEGISCELVRARAAFASGPQLLAQLFRHRCQPAAIGVARQGVDSFRRPARLVSMVLPLLHGPADAGRGCAPDQALEGDPAAHRADQKTLRAGRPDVPAASASGAVALGLRQPQDLNTVTSRHGAGQGQRCTITVAPIFTRLYRSMMSSLVSRMHPDDTASPIFQGSLVPWMR